MVMAVWAGVSASSAAQSILDSPEDVTAVFRDIDWNSANAIAPLAGRSPRLSLLSGLPTGFLQEPFSLMNDDMLSGDEPDLTRPEDEGLIIALGNYNPSFEWHRQGDPGSLGYYKFFSQVQMFDLGDTTMCLNLQALTPAGYQAGGLNQGPTVFTPSLAWFHDLGEGLAMHGFVGQRVRANGQWDDAFDHGFRAGLACQCPILWQPQADQGLFFFFQAVAYHRNEIDDNGPTTRWDLIPGLHWRVNPDCWMTVGASRQPMVTWSWQF
jgi:hypothetical protein